MKIVVTSDAHGKISTLRKIMDANPDADLFLDAGDSESDIYTLYPIQSVKGNCDHDYNLPNAYMTITPFGKLVMRHYPNITTENLKKDNVKIFIHGHLHRREFYIEDGIYIISPGSVAFSRDKYDEGYLILEITEDSVLPTFVDL